MASPPYLLHLLAFRNIANIMKIISKVFSLFIFFAFYLNTAKTQVTLKISNLPGNTPANSKIYFAGSIQAWDPGNPGYELSLDTESKFSIVIPEGTGTVLYKFTRGSWASVEGGPNREEIANRSFSFTGQPQTISITIVSWKDASPSTAAANVQILNTQFNMPQLLRNRRIWLYLPPDYNTATKRYPVLYMQDGQNLFDNSTSFSGEWQVDETLNTLHAGGDYGAIVVGIDNGGGERLNEYSPWNNPGYGGGQGDAYADFMALTLKPYIDANFRTLEGPQNNCLFGSSMGGLIALYGAIKYPQVFGKVGSFSPAYWFSLNNLNNYISNNSASIAGLRIQHTAGQNESANLVAQITQVRNTLLGKGLQTTNDQVTIDPAGTHSESFWRVRFGEAYQWLFPNTTLPVELANFKFAAGNNCSGTLQWETKSEVQNKGFEIQQSIDGIRFQSVAFVKSSGNTATPQKYKYTIQISEKTNQWYRLQQIDTDGSSHFSLVIPVTVCARNSTAIIHPNPSNNTFQIKNVESLEKETIGLYSMEGRLIKSWNRPAQNIFDIKGLPASTYFVSMSGTVVGKIVKF